MDTPLLEALFSRPSHGSAAINWCEADYAFTPHIAELWNSLSSLLFVAAGAHMYAQARSLGLPSALQCSGLATAATGLASAAFHACLQLWAQRADELAENLTLVLLLHGSAGDTGASPPALLGLHLSAVTVGVLLVSAFLFSEVHLIGSALISAWRLSLFQLPNAYTSRSYSLMLRSASVCGAAGAVCWLLDRAACSSMSSLPVNPQLHAWWHALGALCLHEAFACAAYGHLVLNGKPPAPLVTKFCAGALTHLSLKDLAKLVKKS